MKTLVIIIQQIVRTEVKTNQAEVKTLSGKEKEIYVKTRKGAKFEVV